MVTELEEEFFKVFGIEPEYTYIGHYPLTDENGIIQPPEYPEITDRKLLEMICILQKFKNILFDNLYFEKIEDLKNEVLSQIYKCKLSLHEFNAEQLQLQIQQLFKEEI